MRLDHVIQVPNHRSTYIWAQTEHAPHHPALRTGGGNINRSVLLQIHFVSTAETGSDLSSLGVGVGV